MELGWRGFVEVSGDLKEVVVATGWLLRSFSIAPLDVLLWIAVSFGSASQPVLAQLLRPPTRD